MTSACETDLLLSLEVLLAEYHYNLPGGTLDYCYWHASCSAYSPSSGRSYSIEVVVDQTSDYFVIQQHAGVRSHTRHSLHAQLPSLYWVYGVRCV